MSPIELQMLILSSAMLLLAITVLLLNNEVKKLKDKL